MNAVEDTRDRLQRAKNLVILSEWSDLRGREVEVCPQDKKRASREEQPPFFGGPFDSLVGLPRSR